MVDSYSDIITYKVVCKNFIKLGLYNTTSFKLLAKQLLSVKVTNNCDILLKTLVYNHENIDSKKFLSCFMIKHHPKVIITDETDLEKTLSDVSNKLIDIILHIYYSHNKFSMNYYISRFNLYYSRFIVLFEDWKEYDKRKIINDLSTIYLELEQDKNKKYEDLDSLTNHEFITSIEIEQKKLVKKIELIGGEKGLEYLDSLKQEIEVYKKEVEKLYVNINNNLHDAFWNNIREELSKEPPNMEVILEMLNETKVLLVNCNKGLQRELDENIDIEFIKGMLDKDVIDDKYIYNMCNYIIGVLKNCQAIGEDEDLEEFRKDVNERLVKGIAYRDFFPIFFRHVFEKAEQILKDIDIINMIKKSMNE
jgi:hypothetical protein